MAFTSGVAHAATANNHNIELQYNGNVQIMALYDQPGQINFQRSKGDLWEFSLPSCITLDAITRVSVVENGDDGWNIGSIVTLVRDTNNGIQLLTQDFGVNHWIDSKEGDQSFRLTLSRNDNTISGKSLLGNVRYLHL
jgi:hypothetical protein